MQVLKSIRLEGVGPVPILTASFGERLNIITGDNGLGKSFLLDVCFFALTGTWPGGRTAIPDEHAQSPKISFEMQSKTKPVAREASYDFRTQTWSRQPGRPPMPGLIVYAAVDGTFAVWDPARNYWRDPSTGNKEGDDQIRTFQFNADTIAQGLRDNEKVICNGLISDWLEWFIFYTSEKQFPANFPLIFPPILLQRVVSVLSHPNEPLTCIASKKIFVDDSRRFPVLKTPFGEVAFPQWSAGIRRIVSFAYLVVWAWYEHIQAAELRREAPTEQIILIIDEIESHLHPKWQRSILPSLLQIVEALTFETKPTNVQMLVTSHSPLVLASAEPKFQSEQDRLFCFNVDRSEPKNQTVTFDELPWAVHGDVVGWLTSDVFGLEQARSTEAERAIEAAEALMRGEFSQLPQGLSTKQEITEQLRKLLPSLDPFWPRWIVGAKR